MPPAPIAEEVDDEIADQSVPEYSAGGSAPSKEDNQAASIETGVFNIPIKLSAEDEQSIVEYLEDNLPKMRPPEDEANKIRGFFAIYEQSARKRSYPYENAPSLASSDLYDHVNEWLDLSETAFLQQKTTFVLDREEVSLPEEAISRIEHTYQKKYFKPVFSEELRPALFESACLGTSVIGVKEDHNIAKVFKKIVIRSDKDLVANTLKLTTKQREAAKAKIDKNEIYVCDHEELEYKNFGPVPCRVDQTKFWYPRNTKRMKEWEVVAEQEFYTEGAMNLLADQGEFRGDKVKEAIDTRDMEMRLHEKDKNYKLPSGIKSCGELDSNWKSVKGVKQVGDAYLNEYAVYRVTMLYGIKDDVDKTGNIKSWITVMYCPAASCILAASHCLLGFPYRLVRLRPVPYRAMSSGIAQARYHHNLLDTELKSLFLASVEQEVGAPLLIRKSSSLYASGFRSYPGSAAYVDDVDKDVRFMPFPDRTALSSNAMSMVLGSSPRSNLGQGYASGKREEVLLNKEQSQIKARINSIALDLDEVFNLCWKHHCLLAKFNRPNDKVVEFVYDEMPTNTALYILADEMNEELVWSCTSTAGTLTPQARQAEAMQRFQFFYKEVPVLVNNPQKTIAWLNYMSDYFEFNSLQKKDLLPSEEDFQAYQQQLGAQGAQQGGAPQETPLTAQSSATQNHRPAK